MKITKITVENYRLLKNFSIDLEETLSLVIGKNNTGKTSLLSVLNKLINLDKSKFYFDDFNIEFREVLKGKIPSGIWEEPIGIKLRMYIEYNASDSLENLQKVMMDLDPENNFVVLGFEYVLGSDKFEKLKADYREFAQREIQKAENPPYAAKDLSYFLKHNHQEYFDIKKKTIAYDLSTKTADESNFIDLDDKQISIKDIINFKYISAKRDVTNKESDKTLSSQTSKIYKSTEETEVQNHAVENFKDRLIETDDALSVIYKEIFEETITKVKKFGGVKENESSIIIESTLQHRELLEGNTTVFYDHHGITLPEYNNGLGYMNLISMIFEIQILIQEFKKTKNEKPSDINLLFIEEPEAHTHPQMQYVFIKNIKSLLNEGIGRTDGHNRKIQTIITTHSSHIVSESNFDDLKYLKKEDNNSVISKNLTELKKIYESQPKQYHFLKQYLTLNRAEVFFADKVILIEGDTERILFPAFMKKLDLEDSAGIKTPLLSQNISIIEVGAYSHIFEEFIKFVGIKTLIITDLDSVDSAGEKCKVSSGTGYSNSTLKCFFQTATLDDLKACLEQNKVKLDGKLFVAFQFEEEGNNARSFEESFIQINKTFITSNITTFEGLKNVDNFNVDTNDAYDLADTCIKKKTHFALDILYHSDDTFSNWKTPLYIKQGLEWLQQD